MNEGIKLWAKTRQMRGAKRSVAPLVPTGQFPHRLVGQLVGQLPGEGGGLVIDKIGSLKIGDIKNWELFLKRPEDIRAPLKNRSGKT